MMTMQTLEHYDPRALDLLRLFYDAIGEPDRAALLPQVRVAQDTRLVRWLQQGGVTLGKTIHLRGHYATVPYTTFDRGILLAHELVHVAQYQRYGSVGFFARLLWQMVTTRSYERTAIEQEAEALEHRFETLMPLAYRAQLGII